MRLVTALRHSVGARLLLGFWLTIVAAFVCVIVVAWWSSSELELDRLSPEDKLRLERTSVRIQQAYDRGVPLQSLAQPLPRAKHLAVVLYDVNNQQVIAKRSPFFARLENDISRLSEQRSPLSLSRQPYRILGPVPLELGDRPFLLFFHQMTPESVDMLPRFLAVLLCLFGLSIVFSLVFTRSLLRPIKALQASAKDLASGQWDARVDSRIFNRDELGELAHTFNDMAQRLSDNWSQQQRLLADISHELRSPLARLNMAIALAEQKFNDTDQTNETLQRMEREVKKMDVLIGDVLRLSRTEAAMAAWRQDSLENVLQPVFDNAEFESSQQGITLTLPAIPDVYVNVQKEAIQSAVENIIRNAIYYTRHYVNVNIQTTQTHWSVVVEDDGPGLPEQQLDAIFSPFYRSDEARNEDTGGVGLGLAIAKAAATAHHGSIFAKNRPNGGLAVTLNVARVQ